MDINYFQTHVSRTFRIECELGSGCGGAIYKAWHPRLQKFVVIKEDKRDPVKNAENRRNEAEALKNVKSAYLPQVFDYLTDGSSTFTVLEYIEGESFDKMLNRGLSFTRAQVIKWYGQLASALEVIHSQNIYHRDIKPANIMLTPGGNVCLIDFNSALVGKHGSRLVSRSLGYASPEQNEVFERQKATRDLLYSQTDEGETGCADSVAEIDPDAGCETELVENLISTHLRLCVQHQSSQTDRAVDWKRSDIYSLGATMYHLLTGVHPAALTEKDHISLFSGDPRDGIARVIIRSIRRDPMERFASAEELSAALSELTSQSRRRYPTALKLTGLAITAAALMSLAIYTSERRSRCVPEK